jgi:hypothetical protein
MSRHEHPAPSTIFAFEELDVDARRDLEQHLAACEACRDLLTRVRESESRAASVDGLPPLDDDPFADLSPTVPTAAAHSKQALLRRVQAASSQKTPRKILPAFGGFFALAAVLALVLVGPWHGEDMDAAHMFADLRLGPAVVVRGEGDSAGSGGIGNLAPADPAALRFTPARAGWPVVVRLDEKGARLLCPTAEVPGWHLDANLPAVLPPPGSGLVWRAGEPGTTTRWLVALTDDPVSDPAQLAEMIAVADGTRDGVVAFLQKEFGTVGVVSLDPVDKLK